VSTPGNILPARIPPLRNGDHLDREEFERRYCAMPHLRKAELIEGVVYLPFPVRFVDHAEPHANLLAWSGIYCVHTPGVRGGANATVRLDRQNEPQPDALLIIVPAHGGRVTIEDGYITGGPELAVEVAASRVSIERNAKFRAYQRNGICEYLLWRVEDGEIDWFVLRGEAYELLQRGADGIVRSEVFPGLWLDPQALLASDMATVLNILQRGLADPEHAAFLKRLHSAT
jgi:hypothetical protein